MTERRPIAVRIDQGEKVDSYGYDLRQLFQEDELDTYYESLMQNVNHIVEYEDFDFPTLEKLEAAVENPTGIGEQNTMYFGFWYYKVLLGGVHLTPHEHYGELEFWLDKGALHEGNAQIAVTAIKNYFQERSRSPLLVSTSPLNTEAQRVLGRTGFTEMHYEYDEVTFGLPNQTDAAIVLNGERIYECQELAEKIADVLDGDDYKQQVLHMYNGDKVTLRVHTLHDRPVFFVKIERMLPSGSESEKYTLVESIECEVNYDNGDIEDFGKDLKTKGVDGVVVPNSSHTLSHRTRPRGVKQQSGPAPTVKQIKSIVANHNYMSRDNLTEIAQVLDYANTLR